MRVTLLHNPTAGDDPLPAEELVHELRAAGFDATYVAVGSGELDLPSELGEMLIVAGGDGTVRRVVKRAAGRGVPLAILPTGTANNLARSLGQVGAVRRLLAGLRDGVRVPLDLGVVRGAAREDIFVEAFGGGAFAGMIASGRGRSDADRAGFTGNRIDRGLQMFREAIEAHPCEGFRLCLDDMCFDGEFLFVEVMNICCLGPNVPLAPEADPSDGYFDLLLATERDRAPLLEYAEQRLQGLVASPPRLAALRGRRLRVERGEGHLHVDDRQWEWAGERRDDHAIEIELARGALDLVVGLTPRGVPRQPRAG